MSTARGRNRGRVHICAHHTSICPRRFLSQDPNECSCFSLCSFWKGGRGLRGRSFPPAQLLQPPSLRGVTVSIYIPASTVFPVFVWLGFAPSMWFFVVPLSPETLIGRLSSPGSLRRLMLGSRYRPPPAPGRVYLFRHRRTPVSPGCPTVPLRSVTVLFVCSHRFAFHRVRICTLHGGKLLTFKPPYVCKRLPIPPPMTPPFPSFIRWQRPKPQSRRLSSACAVSSARRMFCVTRRLLS